MHISNDFILQKVGGAYVAVPVGETSKTFNGMVRLNETSVFLWNKLSEKDCTEEDLVNAILEEYDVTREIAAADVHRIVEQLRNSGILV